MMPEVKSKVLLILPSETLDRARVVVGRATATLKLPVSLQIVLRALIEEGLKQAGSEIVLENIERQVQAVRRVRSLARQGGRSQQQRADRRSTRARARSRT